MIKLNFEMDSEEIAEAVVSGIDDPEALLEFLVHCDELVADMDFTRRLHARLSTTIASGMDTAEEELLALTKDWDNEGDGFDV